MESSQPSKSAYQSQSASLFVGGLSLSASAKDVGQYFEQFGSIMKVDLPLSKSGQRKGFAFVHFGSQEGVGKALAIKVHIIRGKGLPSDEEWPAPTLLKLPEKCNLARSLLQGSPKMPLKKKSSVLCRHLAELSEYSVPREVSVNEVSAT